MKTKQQLTKRDIIEMRKMHAMGRRHSYIAKAFELWESDVCDIVIPVREEHFQFLESKGVIVEHGQRN